VVNTAALDGVYESIWKLVLALIFYLAMLVITFGIKVPCGLFVPSLTIGAITGRLVGVGMEIISL
jgi:chloride channel 3/4/5